jgi:leader peptidase (prepilin peptidase)/N-methyltransferase
MPLETLCYALFGLVIGSFLNVCIYRIPLGKSIVFPRSGCPHCGMPIRFYDNVPVLSFVLLRGKCRSCKKPISLQYPIVELLSGLAFYGCARVWQFAPPTYVNSLFLSVVLVLVFTDYHHQILPNKLTVPGAVAGVLLSPWQTRALYADRLSWNMACLFGLKNAPSALPWVGSVLGAVIGAGALLAVATVYETVRKREGLGMGDVKMMALVGAFLGWRLAILTFFAGSLIGTLVGIFLILFRNMSLQTRLAFGVFLGVASAFALFYGLPLLGWYLSSFR